MLGKYSCVDCLCDLVRCLCVCPREIVISKYHVPSKNNESTEVFYQSLTTCCSQQGVTSYSQISSLNVANGLTDM